MLTIKFPSGRRARAIILEQAVNGIQGIVECPKCPWRAVIFEGSPNNIVGAIEEFTNSHDCEDTKAKLLKTITIEKLRENIRGYIKNLSGKVNSDA